MAQFRGFPAPQQGRDYCRGQRGRGGRGHGRNRYGHWYRDRSQADNCGGEEPHRPVTSPASDGPAPASQGGVETHASFFRFAKKSRLQFVATRQRRPYHYANVGTWPQSPVSKSELKKDSTGADWKSKQKQPGRRFHDEPSVCSMSYSSMLLYLSLTQEEVLTDC